MNDAMSACIFLGPTLSIESAREVLNAVYLPPVSHGDVYRATLRRPRPRAIGLVDGYFRHRPAVRHKEILWAMSQGIHVFGAASIGALRAVELSDFGMVGIGKIFTDYACGRFEDDDEVAVDHGPAELGYPPLNDTLVDVRATLDRARQQSVIQPESEAALIDIAKQTFYARRTYPRLIDAADKRGVDPAELDRLRSWLPHGKVSQKHQDALALLNCVRSFLETDSPPLTVSYCFERTETWDADVAFATPLASEKQGALLRREDLLDEMRLASYDLEQLRNEALGVALAKREAARSCISISREEAQEFRQQWIDALGLQDSSDLASWQRENHLEGPAFEDFLAERALTRKVADIARDVVDDCMMDALRMRGDYVSLANRALEKQRALHANTAGHMTPAEAGISGSELLDWYCGERLSCSRPADPVQIAELLSFPDTASLFRALLRERLYLQLSKSKS